MTEREALVARYVPLARRLAQRFSGGSEPLEDLEQVAAIGLLKAIDRYDASRSAVFTTFAVPIITGEIKRHFRNHGWQLHVSRTLQERILDMRRVEAALLEGLGHSPTTAELAERLGWTTEAVLEVRAAAAASRPQVARRAASRRPRGAAAGGRPERSRPRAAGRRRSAAGP